MRLGMVGLGRMGSGMTERLLQAGHDVKTFDPNVESTAASLAELAQQLDPPRHVWLMIPAGEVTENAFRELLGILERGDAIVDGGNSNFRDSQRRAAEAAEPGIHFLDAGVSGGIWGLQEGFALMVGGDSEPVGRLGPVFESLAPEGGYGHVGPSGAGHFVKMVHNGIEYGLMQAYAEGFDLMHASEFDLDLGAIAELWRHGSVVRSWLLDLLGRAFHDDPGLEGIRGYVEDSGEGRWTVEQAIETAVPLHVITAALYARFTSREDDSFSAKVNAALREQFGGHAVKRD
ncbi:MAG: decarboxylating 6-phosphogluconate dehydrogenase [Actinomycetota bacterium]|nr:decarboxylating 6-phosphogluconate dehydrogenase [Actinomycetota bacterium]